MQVRTGLAKERKGAVVQKAIGPAMASKDAAVPVRIDRVMRRNRVVNLVPIGPAMAPSRVEIRIVNGPETVATATAVRTASGRAKAPRQIRMRSISL